MPLRANVHLRFSIFPAVDVITVLDRSWRHLHVVVSVLRQLQLQPSQMASDQLRLLDNVVKHGYSCTIQVCITGFAHMYTSRARFKDTTHVVDAFNVDPLYLKHDHQGAAPDFRVIINTVFLDCYFNFHYISSYFFAALADSSRPSLSFTQTLVCSSIVRSQETSRPNKKGTSLALHIFADILQYRKFSFRTSVSPKSSSHLFEVTIGSKWHMTSSWASSASA